MHSARVSTSQHCSSGAASCSGRPQRCALHVVAAVKTSNDKQVICSKTLVAKAENIAEVQRMCKEIQLASAEALTVRKSGVLQFDCMQDRWDLNTFHFYERYDSSIAMGRYGTSPTVMSFVEKVTPLLEGPMGMILYEYRNGQLGHGSVQGGPRGEGGLDDATGASGAAGGASMKQSSSVVDLTFEGRDEEREEEEEGVAAVVQKQISEGLGGFKKLFENIFKK